MLREEYEPDFGPKNRAMTHPEASEKEQAVDAMPLVVVRPGNAARRGAGLTHSSMLTPGVRFRA
jgi:hypothetical protein